MQVKQLGFVFLSKDVRSASAFYTTHFGFRALVVLDWFASHQHPDHSHIFLDLVQEGHAAAGAGLRNEHTRGVLLALVVDDCDKEFVRVQQAGRCYTRRGHITGSSAMGVTERLARAAIETPGSRFDGAAVESARATLVQAERTHASNTSLAAQQFISPIALENSRAQLDAAKAQVNQALAQYIGSLEGDLVTKPDSKFR